MASYTIDPQAVPQTRVVDGTYRYNRVNTSGPSTPTVVTLHDGHLFDFVVGEGQDAQPCPSNLLPVVEARVLAELALYLRLGVVTCTDLDPQPTPPSVGKTAGHALHLALGRLHIRDHKAFAASVLGRPVPSFAQLTHHEWQTVHTALRAQPEVAA